MFNKLSDVNLIYIKVWHLPGVGSERLQQQLRLRKKVFATKCDVACGTGECLNDRRDIPWNRFVVCLKIGLCGRSRSTITSNRIDSSEHETEGPRLEYYPASTLVLQSGLIPLLHTWFLQTLCKIFQTENTCYLILIATEDFAMRISSECCESEINGNTKKNSFWQIGRSTNLYTWAFFWEFFNSSSQVVL